MTINLSQSDYIAVFSLLVPLLVLSFSALRYVNIKRVEQTQQRFENYHALIHKLVRAKTENIGQDSQRAIIFELRRYREYKEVTIRILEGLQKYWLKENELHEEINITLVALKAWKIFNNA